MQCDKKQVPGLRRRLKLKSEDMLMQKLTELRVIMKQSDARTVKLETEGPESRREICLNCAIAVLEYVLK
jgi:hypothetical protein